MLVDWEVTLIESNVPHSMGCLNNLWDVCMLVIDTCQKNAI